MRIKQLFLILALLCAMVQGTRAQNYDVWDGVSEQKPYFYAEKDQTTGFYIDIWNAAQMAYVMKHWNEAVGWNWRNGKIFPRETYFIYYEECDIYLYADLDMTAATWTAIPALKKKFDGRGHHIRIKIEGNTSNYQGLFGDIYADGRVENLHVDGNIHCDNSRLVGGIAGCNRGTISNCWVSADVRSDWDGIATLSAYVGGICGENYYGNVEYCCMTGNVTNKRHYVAGIAGSNSYGTIKNCTFYGSLFNDPDYNTNGNKYVGWKYSEENCFDGFNQGQYDAAGGKNMYRHALMNPYTVTLITAGDGSATADYRSTYPDKTVTLNVTSGLVDKITITDADGNDVSLNGMNFGSSYSFAMPRRNVTAKVIFPGDWPTQGEGTESDPYIICCTEEWDRFAHNVSIGRNYSGKYIKLTEDISVTQKCGTVSGSTLEKAFSGTFNGDGHTITATITDTGNQGTALFCYINGATIKNLKVAGAITGGMHAAAIVGTSEGTGRSATEETLGSSKNVIEGCVATANVSGGTHIGGILGHGTTSDIAISGCVFSGTMTGGGEAKGAIFGWGDNGGTKSVTDCLYVMADGQNTTNLDLVRQWDGTVSVTNCYKTTSACSAGTHCVCTNDTPFDLGTIVQDYGIMMKAYTNGIFYGGTYYMAPATLAGSGTEGDPYLIRSTYEWDSFARHVNEGTNNYSGQYVKLTSDISVSTMVGVYDSKPFSGTFFGNGHTITANITDTGNSGTALFHYINGATIKDLKVAGTITGGIHAAAIVGIAKGTGRSATEETLGSSKNVIEDCVATADVSGGSHIGGILGHATNSDIAISGCVFSGTMTGGGSAKGALFGWGDNGGTKSVTDCLYLMAEGQVTDGLSLVQLNGGTVTTENCYFAGIANVPTNQGTQVYSITPDTYATIENAGAVSKSYDASGLTFYTAGIKYGDAHYAVSGNNMSLTLGDNRLGYTAATFQTSSGTLTGTANPYTLVMPAEDVTISVATWTPDEFTPDANGHYIINNEEDWCILAAQVENGNVFSGKTVRLNADISVSLMVGGTDDNHSFQGVFDGQGHTLTFNKGTASEPFAEEYCAPFRYVKDATIRDLKVMGDIYTSRKFAGGLVACCIGTTNIIGCQVGTLIYSSVSGDGTHGGIVAMPQSGSTLNIEGCVYDGHLLTNSDTNSCGGFVGWHNGATISVSNSFYAPASSIPTGWTAITDGTTFVRGGSPALTNCYFTRALGAEQGRQCFPAAVEPTALGNLVKEYDMLKVYQNGIFYDGIYYMVPVSISLADNADNSTTISDAHGYVADVTLDGRPFYRDGAWNTLCLPFNATKTGPLAKAVIKELDTETAYDGHKTGFEDGTLYLNFKDAESIVAGQPYLVKWNTVSQEYIINPSDEVMAAPDFITEVPTVDDGQATNWFPWTGPEKLVDGKTTTQYVLQNRTPWVEFHYTKAITPKGYAIMTSDYTQSYGYYCNPMSWTIKAKNSGDANWTTLTTVDNTDKDKLPTANNQWTFFKLDNSTAYQYFRFEANETDYFFKLAELRFCTIEPGRTGIKNPTFETVTLQADAPSVVTSEDGMVSFMGTYKSTAFDAEDKSILLMGGENMLYYPTTGAGLGAQHAYFKIGGDGAKARRITGFSIDFGDGEATGIISAEANSSLFTIPSSLSEWYTIHGVKLDGKPTRSGIYIHNGVKVVIK